MINSKIAKNVISLELKAMQDNLIIYQNLLTNLSQEQSKLKLSKGGWTILEVICHLNDYEAIFLNRLKAVVNKNLAELPFRTEKEEKLAQSKYLTKDLVKVLKEFGSSRAKSINYISSINPNDLGKLGIHPQYGNLSLLELILRFSAHDVNHLKQITNILKEHNEI